MNDSKPKLNEENVRRLNEALTRMGADLRERAIAAGRQAGLALAKIARPHE